MGLLNIVKTLLAIDIPRMRLESIARPRPYPYDVTANLTLLDGAAPDTFPVGYTQLIPATTYDFGDSPNRIQAIRLNMEQISANDTYIIEFTKSPDGVTFAIIGAIRFRRLGAGTRSFAIDAPLRPLNIDTMGLYGRLKSAIGGNNVVFSLCVARWFPPTVTIPLSTGVWPWG